MDNKIDIKKLFEENCKKCRYYCSEDDTCVYGSWDRPIIEAISEYLITDTCTFEGDFRFTRKK